MAEKDLKKKKKHWFSILASEDFNQAKLGETLASEVGNLIGRHIRVNLMSLTNEPKKQSFSLVFVVQNVEGDIAHTALEGYYMNQAYLRRMVRKSVQKIEDSFFVVTKDNVKLVVKPVFVTKVKILRGVATRLRKTARELVAQTAKDTASAELFSKVISNKLQMELKEAFKKIYPVSLSEIRVLARAHPPKAI